MSEDGPSDSEDESSGLKLSSQIFLLEPGFKQDDLESDRHFTQLLVSPSDPMLVMSIELFEV